MSSIEELNNKKFKIPIKINEYNPDFDAVGIDLGTTECSAAVIRKNGAEFVVLDNLTSFRTMPSYIIYNGQHPKCGQIAVNRLRNKSKYIVFDSKRILGRDLDEIIVDPLWPFNIREINNEIRIKLANMSIVKSPEEIFGALLKHIKKCVDEFQGRNINEVCQRVRQSEKVLEWKQNKTERKSIISEFLDKFF
uniref:Heat shock protein 70 n=1 Tax=Panagrolaimus sp. PS1159 TaxID=55785 RepID=A0AC35FWB2_9BILA